MATSLKKKRSLIIGAVAVVVLGAIVYVAGSVQMGGLPWAQTTEVKAAFDNVGSLGAGADVRENSNRIGTVTEVTHENGHAVAVLELDGDVPVYSDARAAIWDESALAKHFVELDRGNKDTGLHGADTIPGERNVGAAELDELLSTFDGETRQKLTSAVRELGGGAAGQSRNLHDLLKNAPSLFHGGSEISSTLSDEDAQLPALLRNGEKLTRAFSGHEQRIAALVPELDQTLQAVHVDAGQPLQDTVDALPETLKNVRSSFAELDRPLADAGDALTTARPGAESLGQATPDLRGVLREGVDPLNKVPGVAQKATPAVEGLTQTMVDARPLVPRLSEALTHLSSPLEVLAPYSFEIRTFFDRANSFVSTSAAPGQHLARLGLAVDGPSTATGGLIKDPLLPRNAYPAPGETDRDRAASPLQPLTGGQS